MSSFLISLKQFSSVTSSSTRQLKISWVFVVKTKGKISGWPILSIERSTSSFLSSCFRFPFEDCLALSPFCFFAEDFGLFEVVLLDLRFSDMFSDSREKNTYHQ